MEEIRYAKNSHLIKNKKAIVYAEELLNFLFNRYDVGDYCFDVLNIVGIVTKNGIELNGSTTEVYIYDTLKDKDDEGCNAAHYIIEANGIIYLEIYVYFTSSNETRVFDIRKISSSLTTGFKQLVYQITQDNYNEK